LSYSPTPIVCSLAQKGVANNSKERLTSENSDSLVGGKTLTAMGKGSKQGVARIEAKAQKTV